MSICDHPTTAETVEPDGRGGYYLIISCTVCFQILSRTHMGG